MGPPRAASGATWPTMKPCVAPEKRPSVINATSLPRPRPTGAAVTASISRMPGRRPAFVADHDDVTGADGAGLHGAEAVFLALEDARRTLEVAASLAGELEHAALGREVAV